jgi:KDO2-lipid IV(A) lauroyltransferase
LISLSTRTVPEFIYTAVMWLRVSKGMRLEDATPGGLRRALVSLRQGQMIGLLSDRDFFQNGIPVDFFGRTTNLPIGAARIARETGAPIVPLFTRRLKSGFELRVDAPFYAEKTSDSAGDIRAVLERIVSIYEREFREAPEQWTMFQRVWPEDIAAATLRVFPVGSPLAGRVLGRGANASAPLTVSDGDAGHPLPAADGTTESDPGAASIQGPTEPPGDPLPR